MVRKLSVVFLFSERFKQRFFLLFCQFLKNLNIGVVFCLLLLMIIPFLGGVLEIFELPKKMWGLLSGFFLMLSILHLLLVSTADGYIIYMFLS